MNSEMQKAIKENLTPQAVALIIAHLQGVHNSEVAWFRNQLTEIVGGPDAVRKLLEEVGVEQPRAGTPAHNGGIMQTYKNTSERWGDAVEATIDDYRMQDAQYNGEPTHAWTQNEAHIYCDGVPVADAI